MKLKYLAASVLVSTFASSAAFAATPSAKFAATWSEGPSLASVIAPVTSSTDHTVTVDPRTGYTLATIKVPEQKELLVGVSAEIGLLTDTSVKGKNGGTATVSAGAGAYVHVVAEPVAGGNSIEAAPGDITLSKRFQALTATLGGVIQSCTDGDTNFDGTADTDPNGTIDVATECVVTDEQIGLLQDTTAAHHFNFVVPNLPQGEYRIKAYFTTDASVNIDVCDAGEECLYDPEGTVSGTAQAKAVIGKTMLTVQQVRAAKGGVIEADIVE